MAKKTKRGPRVGSVIFYTLYCIGLVLFAAALFLGLQRLNGYLVEYEAAYPENIAQNVFEELFQNPDWEELYTLAGIDDTRLEGSAAFAQYMEAATDGKQLRYQEVPSGNSESKKYLVKADDSLIGCFRLQGKDSALNVIPEWKFQDLELYFQRLESCTLLLRTGSTAYLNGVPLGIEDTIATESISLGNYAPLEYNAEVSRIQSVSNLLVPPEVRIVDGDGNDCEVLYNSETGMYEEVYTPAVLGDAEKAAAISAAKTYGEFMINAAGSKQNILKYFDSGSQVYLDLCAINSELWMNADHGHRFTKEEIVDFCQFSDSLFCAHVRVTMNTNLKYGGTKDYIIDCTLFFHKKNGTWLAYEMTNEDLFTAQRKVRITFCQDDTVLKSEFFDSDCRELISPVLSTPAGKVFSGWVRLFTDENGGQILSLVLTPDENGHNTLPEGYELMPITLYPLFEDAQS